MSSVLGSSETHNIVCAVGEARGVSPSVCVAFINVFLGEAALSQICDNQSYVKTIHKVQLASPSRIIIPSTAYPPYQSSVLYSLLEQLLPNTSIDSYDRSAWSETAGLAYIQRLAFEDEIEPVKFALDGKFYATACFSAESLFVFFPFHVTPTNL